MVKAQQCLDDFNPRSRVGNDLSPLFPWGLGCKFQSTFPRGERLILTLWCQVLQPISIHVPAWGTTISVILSLVSYIHFNPRSRVGNDYCNRRIRNLSPDFNPRSRVGNDCFIVMLYHAFFIISIHVPAWGTTKIPLRSSMPLTDFNPRSRVGNDILLLLLL